MFVCCVSLEFMLWSVSWSESRFDRNHALVLTSRQYRKKRCVSHCCGRMLCFFGEFMLLVCILVFERIHALQLTSRQYRLAFVTYVCRVSLEFHVSLGLYPGLNLHLRGSCIGFNKQTKQEGEMCNRIVVVLTCVSLCFGCYVLQSSLSCMKYRDGVPCLTS